MASSTEELTRTCRVTKKNRVEEEAEEGEGEDRISGLNDELLHMILSFMNTKYAVRTCVLSKRCESLWKSLPYLDFNITTFPFNDDRYEGYADESLLISLNNFITQVLIRRHHTDLVRVCFEPCGFEPYVSVLEGLIAYAVDHNVQQLTIEGGVLWDFLLPQSFYTCKSLTALQVHDPQGNTIKLHKFLALPALKSLHLHGFSITNKYFNPGDFSACPNLETLKLSDIYFDEDKSKTLFINAPNLKRLELSFRWSDWGNGCNKVVIDTPKLMTFQYSASPPILCSFDDLASINDAYFDINDRYLHYYDEEDDEDEVREYYDKCREYVLHFIDTLKKFRQAKSLTLSWKTVEALSVFPSLLDENRLPFSNLKHLKINLEKGQRCDKVDIPGCVLNFFLNSFTMLKLCL